MVVRRVFRVVESFIYVSRVIFVSGEHKAHFGRAHHGVLADVAKLVFVEVVRERILRRFDGANGAYYVGEGGCGFAFVAVLALREDIEAIESRDDKEVALYIHSGDYFFIKLGKRRGIVHSATAESGEQLMLLAFQHLLGRKLNIHEVFAYGARERLFYDSENGVALLLGKHTERLIEFGNDLALFVNENTANVIYISFIRTIAAAQFCDFFFVHFYSSFAEILGYKTLIIYFTIKLFIFQGIFCYKCIVFSC